MILGPWSIDYSKNTERGLSCLHHRHHCFPTPLLHTHTHIPGHFTRICMAKFTNRFIRHAFRFLFFFFRGKANTQKERYSAKSNKIGRPLVTHPSSLGDRSEMLYVPIGCCQPSHSLPLHWRLGTRWIWIWSSGFFSAVANPSAADDDGLDLRKNKNNA